MTGEVAFDFDLGKGLFVVFAAVPSSIDAMVQEQYKRSISLLLGIAII